LYLGHALVVLLGAFLFRLEVVKKVVHVDYSNVIKVTLLAGGVTGFYFLCENK